MNDLSKRLREWGEPKGYSVCVYPGSSNATGDRLVPARDMMQMWSLLREAADALDARWQTMESAPDGNDEVLVGYMHPVAGWTTKVAPRSLVRQLKHIVVESRIHAAYYYWHPLPPPPEDV